MGCEIQTNLILEATPSDPKHVVNAAWVTEFVTGKMKMPVRTVSAVNIAGAYSATEMTFKFSATGAAVINGVTLGLNDRVFLVGQTAATQNGIYIQKIILRN